jgi:hypothetical protein
MRIAYQKFKTSLKSAGPFCPEVMATGLPEESSISDLDDRVMNNIMRLFNELCATMNASCSSRNKKIKIKIKIFVLAKERLCESSSQTREHYRFITIFFPSFIIIIFSHH